MTASSSHKLTPQALKKLYCITFSDVGSRKRRDEEDTVYFFEIYLQECEGKQSKQLSLWQTVIVSHESSLFSSMWAAIFAVPSLIRVYSEINAGLVKGKLFWE